MDAKTNPPVSDQVNQSDDAIDEAIASAAAKGGAADPDRMVPVSLTATSRRGFLRGALAVAGGTAAAAAIAACAPASGSAWSYAPLRTLTAAAATPETAAAEEGAAEGAAVETTEPLTEERETTEPLPEGWTEHDMAAREKVRRYVGNLAVPLGMDGFIGTPEQDPEFTLVEHGNQPLEPTIDGDWKVFEMTVNRSPCRYSAISSPSMVTREVIDSSSAGQALAMISSLPVRTYR